MAYLMSVLPFSNLDNDEFNLMTYELNHGRIIYDPTALSMLHFNPFILDQNRNQNFVFSYDIDPDDNMLGKPSRCLYYTNDEFNDLTKKQPTIAQSLSVLHLNIRSLTHNFSQLTDLLNASGIKFSGIG